MPLRKTLPSTDYRADIDGLRAIAVLAVVLFHLEVPPFTGGYVGVDIFFVISGFLITRLLLADIAGGSFSLIRFYERRARRILPALFVVLFAASLAAYFLFMPRELVQFGESLAAVALFLSNFHFWNEVGYFDLPATYKPLLHTWSLAVEEQFYVLYPLFLLLVARRASGSALLSILAACALLSFVLSLYLTQRAPAAAFYLLPSRAAELLIGAIIATMPAVRLSRATAEALCVLCLGLIGFAIIWYDTSTPFPGLAAVLPCVGTAGLIIAGGARTPWVIRGLSWHLLVAIGLISYPLYLWHWPIFVFAEYYAVRDLTGLERALIFFISIVLAALSWRIVERPFRHKRLLARPSYLFAGVGATTGLVIVFAVAIVGTQGLPHRLPSEAIAILDPNTYLHGYRDCHSRDPERLEKFDVCIVGDPNAAAPSFLILGDSHADMLEPAIVKSARALGRSGVVFTRGGCAPVLGTRPARGVDEGCRRTREAALAYLRFHPEITDIIAAGYWRRQADGSTYDGFGAFRVDDESAGVSAAETLAAFRRGLARLVAALPCRNIYLVGDSPEVGFEPPNVMARLKFLGRNSDLERFSVPWEAYTGAQAVATAVLRDLAQHERVTYVPVDDVLCPRPADPGSNGRLERLCPIVANGRLLYRNGDHLSVDGAAVLTERFQLVLSGRLARIDKERPLKVNSVACRN